MFMRLASFHMAMRLRCVPLPAVLACLLGAVPAAANSGSLTALRGFEWSSDRFGHIDVFGSRGWVDEAQAGGYVSMDGFWQWFTTGAGRDRLATFNHPSAKSLDLAGTSPGDLDWNDFAYVPAADERMVGIEAFNDQSDNGSRGGYPEGSYARALDKGWHVGAVGAEDLGLRRPPLDSSGGPAPAKTVVLATENTPQGIRAALMARRFYAVGPGEGRRLRLSFTVDGEQLGTRLQRRTGDVLRVRASANDPDVALDLVTSGGKVVATGTGKLDVRRDAVAGERWYFVRARRGDRPVGYTSPIWIESRRDAPRGQWLAGDGHVHTCYSHDAYCPPDDDNTGPDTAYSSFGTVAERFAEAALKDLDFVVVSDHDDTRAWADPAFGSKGVIGVHAYERSLSGGHAHALGVARELPGKPDARSFADDVRRAGGLFQINHPTYKGDASLTTCAQAAAAGPAMYWKFGFTVPPDTLEVWNATTLLQPSEVFWECWLQAGVRVPAIGGSDSHGANQANLGSPTTWVLARDDSEQAILEAIRAGRTTITRLPPVLGGARLVLEADGDRNGSFESTMGDTIEPGAPMRVRSDGLSAPATVRVRANGATLVERTLEPGGEIRFDAPAQPGWVRASLLGPQNTADADPFCAQGNPASSASITLCTADLAYLAMTSPVWVERALPRGDGDPPAPPSEGDDGNRTPRAPADEPDDDRPLAPAEQSRNGAPLPTVPAQPRTTTSQSSVRLPALRLVRAGRLLRLRPAGWRYDVQVRKRGAKRWRTIRRASTDTVVAVPRRARVRARLRRPDGHPSRWVSR